MGSFHAVAGLLLLLLCASVDCVNAQTDTTMQAPVAPSAQENTATDDKATVYFYRTKQYAGSALEPSVYCDDKELARMDNGRYFAVRLAPGKHTFRMGDKQTGVELDVKAGQSYYMRINIEAGFFKGRGRLTYMQPEQGAYEIKNIRPLGASKIKNRELVVVNPATATDDASNSSDDKNGAPTKSKP